MKRLFVLLLLAGIVLTACAPAQATATPAAADQPKTPLALQPTPSGDVLFEVVKPDGTSIGFTWDDLKALPLAAMTAEGKVEEGVTILSVLNAAGVTEFSEIALSGSSSPATLTYEQVQDPTTILDFTNHGTVKLSTTYIPKANWTKDVSKIEVK